MRLSTKCSIALHCLIFIAEYEKRIKVTGELLAQSTGCNPAAIRSILNVLQKSGIISVTRGIGGAHLSRDPRTLTMWEIYRTLEPNGLKHLMGFHPNPSEHCPVGRQIEDILAGPYQRIGSAAHGVMEEITLQQLLNDYHSRI